MIHPLRSAVCTEGRRMAGARALWVANGMKREQFGKPIIAIANSFTQFVPGHTHLHEAGQIIKNQSTDNIKYSEDNKYTYSILVDAINRTISKSIPD